MMNRFITLYATIRKSDGLYFAGFDRELQEPRMTSDINQAKLVSNKFTVRLRPDEEMVEVKVHATEANSSVSRPFIPKPRDPNYVMDSTPGSEYLGKAPSRNVDVNEVE